LWESSLDACFLLRCERDGAGHVTDFVFAGMNLRGAAALGLARDAAVGRRLCELVPIQRDGALYRRYVEVAETGATLDEECELNLAEIDARWIRQQVIATDDGIAIIARDISGRKLEESGNRQSGVFLRALIDSLPVLISVKSARSRDFGDVVVWNQAAERITGYTADEVADRTIGAAVPPEVDSVMGALDAGTPGVRPPAGTALTFVTRDGATRQLRAVAVQLPDRYGDPEFVLGIADDITELVAARKQLEQHANYDALTGLPNRRLFMDRLTHALERCTRSGQGLALLFIDLDNFKGVNDRLGHPFGDELLKEVGRRLSRSARTVDTVCRLSGDEFTVVMEDAGFASLHEAGIVAMRIIAALNEPFAIGGHTINVTASVGISICPVDGTDAEALIRHADRALYRAKALGKNTYQYFSAIPDGGVRGYAAPHAEQGREGSLI
jgi:diguanylate cyclase (GGDEF)-like protein/PAS domain S-box-containing protein